MIVSQTIQSLARIAEVVSSGGIIAFRTDTFYGLGADPFNRQAVNRIKELKGREEAKAILVIISDHDQIERFIWQLGKGFGVVANDQQVLIEHRIVSCRQRPHAWNVPFLAADS